MCGCGEFAAGLLCICSARVQKRWGHFARSQREAWETGVRISIGQDEKALSIVLCNFGKELA